VLARPGDELVGVLANVLADVQRDLFVGEEIDLAIGQPIASEPFSRLVREQARAFNLGGIRLWMPRVGSRPELVGLVSVWFLRGSLHPRRAFP
jgi:hypothetical protein